MAKGAPADLQGKFAAALRLHQAGRSSEADLLYRQILEAAPRHADTLHYRGLLASQTDRPDLAVQLISKAIVQNARVPTFHHNLGVVLSGLERHSEAAAAFRQAVSLNPQMVQAHFNLGVSLQCLGAWDEAVSSYARTLALEPKFPGAHVNLGMIRFEQGRLEEAAALAEQALTHDPGNVEAHNGLGNALRQRGKLEAALAAYRRALEIKSDFVEAHDNVGMVFLERGMAREALLHFDQALKYRPRHAAAHSHRANALKELGHAQDASMAYRRALELAPDDPNARLGLAIAAIPLVADDVAMANGAISAFGRALEDVVVWDAAHPGLLGDSVGRNLPFYLAYRPGDITSVLATYGDLMSAAAARQWPEAMSIGSATRPVRQRLHLAIVSGHVQRHPVWDIILRGMLMHFDRQRIHVTVYHTASAGDDEALWARSRVDRWVQGPKSMQAWLAEVAMDLPDVLLYPEVGMYPITWALAALRLAPLQIAAWGHPVTTGLPTIDVFLSGQLLEPPGGQAHYRERLLTLPLTGVCTDTALEPARPWAGPPRAARAVRFALCQQAIKFDPADDELLAHIARAAGPAEFWLVSPRNSGWTCDKLHLRLTKAFRAVGVDPETHLFIAPWMPPEQFAGFLDAMDIYLDCPAFSGYTTARQAVRRGLPIVTVEGPFMRQRLASGLLRQIDVTEGIAASREHYLEIAVRWASECRSSPHLWAARRAALSAAAPQADDNRDAAREFERFLTEKQGRAVF